MGKTAKGLVEYAKAQLGTPYWYGSFGQAASLSFYNEKKRQYPDQYKWAYTPEVAGQKVHDCVGLIKGYLWCDSPSDKTPVYNAAQDKSANGMYSVCTVKGDIDTMPEVPGVLVFMNHHVGVYIGNGEVIESRGHSYGTIKTEFADRPWTSWGYCPYIEYEKEEPKKNGLDLPMLQKGSRGDTVKAMQILLIGYGYSCGYYGADGDFGNGTHIALVNYQGDHELATDGICGPATWRRLLGVG